MHSINSSKAADFRSCITQAYCCLCGYARMALCCLHTSKRDKPSQCFWKHHDSMKTIGCDPYASGLANNDDRRQNVHRKKRVASCHLHSLAATIQSRSGLRDSVLSARTAGPSRHWIARLKIALLLYVKDDTCTWCGYSTRHTTNADFRFLPR